MQNLNDLAKKIHENAKAKGFWDEPRNTGEMFMLIVSELAEALEADRNGKRADMIEFNESIDKYLGKGFNVHYGGIFEREFKLHIKDTVEDELADTTIRILEFCFFRGYDFDAILNMESVMNCCSAKPTENFGHNIMCITATVSEAFLEENNKPCGPLLGCAIKAIQSLSKHMGFDLMRHVELKMQYNSTREHKHGKKY